MGTTKLLAGTLAVILAILILWKFLVSSGTIGIDIPFPVPNVLKMLTAFVVLAVLAIIVFRMTRK